MNFSADFSSVSSSLDCKLFSSPESFADSVECKPFGSYAMSPAIKTFSLTEKFKECDLEEFGVLFDTV